MSFGLKKAEAIDADILAGTDPDSDRVGIGVKDQHGHWVLMNGNQTAVLAFNYMIEARKAKGIAQANDMVVKTIVTTDMIDKFAAGNGINSSPSAIPRQRRSSNSPARSQHRS